MRTYPPNWWKTSAGWATMRIRSLWRGSLANPIRILFTLDKGIGDLRHYPARQHAGVVLFRPAASGRGAVAVFVRDHLDQVLGMDLHGKHTVAGATRIRIR